MSRHDSDQLSEEEERVFVRDGVLIRRGAVSPSRIEAARDLVGAWLRHSMRPEHLGAYTERTFAPELGANPDLLALFNGTVAASLAKRLLGSYDPVTTAQIQIRLPERAEGPAQPVKDMHVDGVACPHLDSRDLRTFDLLVGVVLSDVRTAESGALHYQPGGHMEMAEWFRKDWSPGAPEQVPAAIGARTGTPFLGRPGDVLLMHHLVPHAVGANQSTEPRIMAYFRVSHPRLAERRLAALRDPFLDYPPLAPHTSAADGHQ